MNDLAWRALLFLPLAPWFWRSLGLGRSLPLPLPLRFAVHALVLVSLSAIGLPLFKAYAWLMLASAFWLSMPERRIAGWSSAVLWIFALSVEKLLQTYHGVPEGIFPAVLLVIPHMAMVSFEGPGKWYGRVGGFSTLVAGILACR